MHWTIEVPDDVAERVTAAAAERGVAPEQLFSEVGAEQFPPRRKLGFVGLGHSGHTDTSRRIKELRKELADEKFAQMAEERRRSAEG